VKNPNHDNTMVDKSLAKYGKETSPTPRAIHGQDLKKANVEFVCGEDKMFCQIRHLNTKKIHIVITKELDLLCWELEADCEDLRQKDSHWSSFSVEQTYTIVLEALSSGKCIFKIEAQFARMQIPFQMGSIKFDLKMDIPEKKCDSDSLVSLQGEQIRKLMKKMEHQEKELEMLKNRHPKLVFLVDSLIEWNCSQVTWTDFPNAVGEIELKQGQPYKWDLLINGLRGLDEQGYTHFRLHVESNDKSEQQSDYESENLGNKKRKLNNAAAKTIIKSNMEPVLLNNKQKTKHIIYLPSGSGIRKKLTNPRFDESVIERNILRVDKSAVYTIKLQVHPRTTFYWSSGSGSVSLFVE